MGPDLQYRPAIESDLRLLAELRWHLRAEDRPALDPIAHDQFVAEFVRLQQAEWNAGAVQHWIATQRERAVAAMSVIFVKKLPAPDELQGRWGYLTNCYVLPEMRNAGVGTALLTLMKAWALAERDELLLLWPSDRA